MEEWMLAEARENGCSCGLYVSLILHILRLRNAISPLCPHFRANRWGNSDRLYFLGSKITADGDWNHEIKRHLLLGRKVMTNLYSILKSRDITLSTKVCLVKAMVFPAVMWELDYKVSWALKNWCFWTVVLEKTLESPLDCRDPSSPS